MNLKLLVAACLLLAVVQARPPRPLSTSCSASCVSRTFWSGYQAGRVYTYDFDQSVELSSELNPSQTSRLRISGQAKVEVHSDCEMALIVDVKHAQVGDVDDVSAFSPREPPAKVLAGLRAPLRFAFDNGRVAEICPGAEETRASLNLKRGLLSQLQVSTEQRGQAHELEERDILGDCWTEYTPEGPNTLIKTKDLSKCKLNYQAYPLLGVKSFEDETTQSKRPITKGSLTCRIEIDPGRDLVKSTSCKEEQRQSVRHQDDSIEETIRTTTRLTLKSEESGLVSALHEVGKRTDLRHDHKTSKQCQRASAWLDEDFFHSANECVERSHGAQTSAEYMAKANKTLEDLCEATKDHKMSREVPKKYADLIKYMRGITEKSHLSELYQQVRAGRYCRENPLLLVILRSAIPTVGTKESVAFIVDQLKNSEVSTTSRNDWIVNGVALMQHPTTDILPELLSYVRFLRNQDEALITGVNRDEPLALSAVVHKICQELPNCESDSKVKAVIDYFADSLGPQCAKLTGADSDNAFVALLAIGNMGRMNGGAKSIVQCAINQRLPTVYRAFALHSLRRFSDFSNEAQTQLIDLMLDSEQDAEVRIAAFQALARQGFSDAPRLREAVRSLLDNADADRQVQMFVYTHLQTLKGLDARMMSPVLLGAKTARELKKLSRHQYSNVIRGQYYSPALEAGAQLEVPIVFSAQSAIPRYLGLNLTVNLPSQGQSINLMEIGLRMQGLEKLIEQTYSQIAKRYGTNEPSEEASATTVRTDDLSDEQRRLEQTPTKPRIDLLVRRYGAELSHTDLSGGILESIPTLISSGQAGSFMPTESRPGASAGTLMESTLSIPTTSGLPILVKQEAHYITNLNSDMNISKSSGFEATVQLQPTAAVQLMRTVAIDAIFERAGIQSSTSFLTSTGLRVSFKNSLEDPSDRRFLVKIEPLNKKQRVAEMKTEVKFFQHTAGKQHVEKALTPQQTSVKVEKCIEGLAKKLGGHKICYKTESIPICQTSPYKMFQCPNSYQMFLEKSDDFGAFEVSYKWKNQPSQKQLQLLVGDQKSKGRLLKINIQSISLRDKVNYKFELQNPIFPINVESNFTKSGAGQQVNAKAQFGSVEYVASGSVTRDSIKGVVIEGEFNPKDRTAQKVQVSLEHKFSGWTQMLLPIAKTKLQAKMHTKNELSLKYELKQEESNFFWQMSSEYKTQKGETTAAHYRVQYKKTSQGTTETSNVFLYDFALQNPLGKNLMHSLHSKLIRGSDAEGKQYTATVSHKLQYGSDSAKSPLDFDARFSVKKVAQSQNTEITGDGEFTYSKEGASVTAKVERLKIQIGEFTNATDGIGKQYKYSLGYAIKFEGETVDYQAEFQHLPWGRWSRAKQAVQLKAKAQFGSKSYLINMKHVFNADKWLSEQIAKAEYNDYVYFHVESKLKKAKGLDTIRHELFLQDSQSNKLEIKSSLIRPEEGVVNADMIAKKNDQKFLRISHSFRLKQVGRESDHELKHKMTMETRASVYSIDNSIKVDRESISAVAEFMNYQVRLFAGRYRIGKSLQLLIDLLRGMRFEHESKLTGPTSTQQITVQNVIKPDSPEGEIWKHVLQINGWSESQQKFGVNIERTKEGAGGSEKGIKVEIYIKDQSVKSKASYNTDSYTLKVASEDTWGLHNLKMDAAWRYLTTATRSPKYEALFKLEGQINRIQLNSNLNVTGGIADSEKYIIATLTAPESKLRLRLESSAVRKAGELQFNGDFAILPFKSMKIKSIADLQNGIEFESEAEIDSTKIIAAKLKAEQGIYMIDLKTAHPILQEAGIKVQLDSGIPETIKFDLVAKLISLTKSMQLKKSGTATLSRNSPGFSFLLGLTGKAELDGFESLSSYKKIDYELMLKKKPTMEFEVVTSISSPDYTATKEPMLFFTSSLNYWPFKAEAKVKANNYKGWGIQYGARAALDSKNAFVGVEYKDKEAAATYEIEDLACGTRKVNFRVKCTFCSNTAPNLIVGQANMTYPMQPTNFQIGLDMDLASSKLQMVAFRIEHRPSKKQILAAFRWDGNTQKLIDCTYTQTDSTSGINGQVLVHSDLRFFLGDAARIKLSASYNYGSDKALNITLSLAESQEDQLKVKLFWLNTPRSYPDIPVASIDRGMQIKGWGIAAYLVRTVKSNNNYEWKSSLRLPKLSEPISANWEWENSRIKSGIVNAFGRQFTLTSGPEGEIQVNLRTSSEEASNIQVKLSGKHEGMQDMRGKITIEADGEANIIEVKVQPKQIVIKYGKSAGPNSLRIDYEMGNSNFDFAINHETDADKNSELTLWPSYKVRLPTTSYPMKLTISTGAFARSVSIVLKAPRLGVKTMDYSHDLTNFPKTFKIESNLLTASDKNIWEIKLDVDLDMLKVETTCKIGDNFKLSLKEPKLELQLKDTIDLKMQFPRFLSGIYDSDKKEMNIEITLPAMQINEPINLNIVIQQLTEGRQIKVKYGVAEDTEQIVWQLTARKYQVKPRFSIDMDTSLTSKFDLLYSWSIRSLEARLESSMEGDFESYTAVYKDSIKVNGQDLMATDARFDGQSDALIRKAEVQITGQIECNLNFEARSEDRPAIVTISVDKLGESRQKYSLKLRYTPAKWNAMVPDFGIRIECPHRQFLISKELKETTSKSQVAIEFYIDKRQSHGATILYESEGLSSPNTRKYTLEVTLPTRKIRIDCQPEVTDKKIKVKNTFAWDVDASAEKIIELTTKLDTTDNIEAELECKAPFFRRPVKLEARIENTETGYTLKLKHKNGETNVLTVKADYSSESQKAAQFKLEIGSSEDSKFILSVRARKDSVYYDWYKIDGSLKMKIGSLEKNIELLYRPMREITVSCDQGASLSLKYSADGNKLYQLVAFASANDKMAARMKLLVSVPTQKITIKLDKGRGSFNHNTDLRMPNYTPEKVLLLSKISVSRKQFIATVFQGEMTVGQKPNLLDAESLPTHLSFFGLVYSQVNQSTFNFRINWRTPSQEKIDSAIESLQRGLNNYKSSASPALEGVQESLATLFDGANSMVDGDWIAAEVRQLASNDIDQLSRYVERVLGNDEFFLGTMLSACKSVNRYVQKWSSAVAEAMKSWKEAIEQLQIPQLIAKGFENALDTAAMLYNKIPIQGAIESLKAFVEQVKEIANGWNQKLTDAIDTLKSWLSDLTDFQGIWNWNYEQVQEYLDRKAPITSAIKNGLAKIWSHGRTMLAATIAGAKPLVVDDILPLGMNHIGDVQIVRNLYNNLMLELRLWYDMGASSGEREALTQTSQLISYIFSEKSLNTWRYWIDTAKMMLNGDIREGIDRLGDQIKYTVWRPECNEACQRGEAPYAALEGEIINNNYMPSWSSYSAPQIVLRRVFNKLMRSGSNKGSNNVMTILEMALGKMDLKNQLLAIRHRTTILFGENNLITFDGVALNLKRPCSYLIAHDFECSEFSIVQEYQRDSTNPERQVRGSLKIRFGALSLSVERNGTVKLNDKTESLPVKKRSSDGKSVDASRVADLVTVRFHGKLPDTLVIRCSRSADSCLISVHPLYQGRVLGLAGSNDGRRENDIREGLANRHSNFWTAGQCTAEAASGSSAEVVKRQSDRNSGDCYSLLDSKESPLSDCFKSVDPQPYRSICRQQRRQDSNACDVARLYAARCSAEGITVQVPSRCAACQVDSDGPIVTGGKVSSGASLQARMQVVFLVEDNACGYEAAVPAQRIRELAHKIYQLKASHGSLKSIKFGIARFGEAVSALPVNGQQPFGSYAQLEAVLDNLRLSPAPSSSQMNALQAVADLSENYQWERLAQKHLFVITCKPCRGVAWNYNALFAKAQHSLKDQVFVHTISKTAIEATSEDDIIGYGASKYYTTGDSALEMDDQVSRRFKSECTVELAMDSDNQAKGSVWRLDKFYESSGGSGRNQVAKSLVTNEIARHLSQPRCRRCSCQSAVAAAKCRIVECDRD